MKKWTAGQGKWTIVSMFLAVANFAAAPTGSSLITRFLRQPKPATAATAAPAVAPTAGHVIGVPQQLKPAAATQTAAHRDMDNLTASDMDIKHEPKTASAASPTATQRHARISLSSNERHQADASISNCDTSAGGLGLHEEDERQPTRTKPVTLEQPSAASEASDPVLPQADEQTESVTTSTHMQQPNPFPALDDITQHAILQHIDISTHAANSRMGLPLPGRPDEGALGLGPDDTCQEDWFRNSSDVAEQPCQSAGDSAADRHHAVQYPHTHVDYMQQQPAQHAQHHDTAAECGNSVQEDARHQVVGGASMMASEPAVDSTSKRPRETEDVKEPDHRKQVRR